MKRKQFIVCRNDEYIGRFPTLEQAQEAKEAEYDRLVKCWQQGWFTGPVDEAFRLDIVIR